MLGRTPPEGSKIPQAIWNNMRTIGDSHVPILGFKDFLNEGGVEPVKPVVTVRPDPQRKQPNPEKNPEKKETELPERKPASDTFERNKDFPEFRPYRKSGK